MQGDAQARINAAHARLLAGDITEEEYQRIVKEARRTTMLEPPAPSQARKETPP